MESKFYEIIRKSGRKPVSCKCNACKQQCKTAPCLGLPEDIEKLIDAGHGEKIFATGWAAGIFMGVTNDIVSMYQAELTPDGCVFLKDGLCSLHDSGLKPTEGKLSHHTQVPVIGSKNLTWIIAKEWLDEKNAEIINRIKEKLKLCN
jgi:hypothetical protein